MDIAAALGVAPSVFLPVRLVSHDLRLLGVLSRAEKEFLPNGRGKIIFGFKPMSVNC